MQNVSHQVLLIGEDTQQTELLSDLVREVTESKIDVLSRVESAFDWVGPSSYQLVVIDTSTSLDGLSVLERIKRLSPETGVILISEQATVEHAVAAIRMGAEDYLKKPFNPEAFQLAVKRGLDRKAIFGGNTSAAGYLNLLNACQMISASLDQQKIFGIIRSFLSRELSSNHAAIYTLVDGGLQRLDQPGDEENRDRAMEEVMEISLQALGTLSKLAEAPETEFYRFMDRGQLTPGLFVFRFKCAGDQQYFCVTLSPERPESLEAFESRLRMLKAQAEMTGKNITEYQGVQNLAYMDDVTGLYNTRYLHTLLEKEITQSKATGKSFAILFVDADKFKSVNDTHGHLVGTKLLNALGMHLKSCVREKDTVFRYGGDEFVAVLSPSDLVTAKAVAERFRQSVEQTSFLKEEGIDLRFTVSIGVALFPEHAHSKEDVIAAADRAMYDAKKSTRNSVFIAKVPHVA